MTKQQPFQWQQGLEQLESFHQLLQHGEFCIENMSFNKIHVRVIPGSSKILNQRGFFLILLL